MIVKHQKDEADFVATSCQLFRSEEPTSWQLVATLQKLTSRLLVAALFIRCIGLPSVGLLSPSFAEDATHAWRWQKNIIPKALVVPGIWGETFKVDQALDKAGFRQGHGLKNLSRFNVIVLTNVPALRVPKDSLQELRNFVSHGGGLVVLGGLSAYWNGGYSGTLLEEMLPVSIKQSYIDHFPSAEKGAKLSPGEKADWTLRLDFQSEPTAYYFHKLLPKSNAKVQVKVGDQPALVSGTFGKGRVVACALTVNGNPAPGVLAFWDWKDWPALLGTAIDWAGGARPTGKSANISKAAGPEPLTEDELESLELDLEELPKNFVARAMATSDERAAEVLIELAAPGEGEETKCALDVVLPSLLPYAKPEWSEKLETLAAKLNPNIKTRNAALSLLGACRNPESYTLLTEALNDTRSELAAMDGLGLLGNRKAIPLLRKRFKEVLDTARLSDGPARFKPAEFALASQPATHAAIALYRLGDAEGVSRLCSFAVSLNLYRRIMWNATKRWPRDPVGQQILKTMRGQAAMQQEAWNFLERNVGPIPESQSEAFTKFAATVEDHVLIELLASAMEKSTSRLPEADWQQLAKAKSGVITRMAKALGSSAADDTENQ